MMKCPDVCAAAEGVQAEDLNTFGRDQQQNWHSDMATEMHMYWRTVQGELQEVRASLQRIEFRQTDEPIEASIGKTSRDFDQAPSRAICHGDLPPVPAASGSLKERIEAIERQSGVMAREAEVEKALHKGFESIASQLQDLSHALKKVEGDLPDIVGKQLKVSSCFDRVKGSEKVLVDKTVAFEEPLFPTHNLPPSHHSAPTRQVSGASNVPSGRLPQQPGNRTHLACDPETEKQMVLAKARKEAKPIVTEEASSTSVDQAKRPMLIASLRALYDRQRMKIMEWRDVPESESAFTPLRVLMLGVKSNVFDAVTTLVIVVNSIFLGYGAEYAITNPEKPTNDILVFGNWFFMTFYSIEIALRLVTFRLMFFVNADWRWNLFDLFLVLTSVYSQVSNALTDPEGGGSGQSSVMRLFRLLKIMKMLRMIRVMRFFRELRLMLMPIIQSMRSLLWTLVMLFIILYVFGITMLQASAGAVLDSIDQPVGTGGLTIDEIDELRLHWGSVGTSMVTLYMAVTGGNDWGALAEPLKHTGLLYYSIFLFYIAFLTFAVLNILTGIFVDTAMSYSAEDAETVQLLEMDDDNYLDMLADVLAAVDADDSGSISYEEFLLAAHRPAIQSFLEKHDITVAEAKVLMWRLSANGTDDVFINDFLHVFTRMKGQAKQMDLQALTFDTKRLATAIESLSGLCSDRLDAFEDVLRKDKGIRS